MTRLRIPSAIAAILALTACASSAVTPEASPTEAPSSRPPAETAQPSASADAAPDAPQGIPQAVWDAIIEDLSPRTDEPVASATVVMAEAMTWNDGSLGCPVAGQVYTQALVDGYQVVLEVDGQEYDYRVGAGDDVRLCRD